METTRVMLGHRRFKNIERRSLMVKGAGLEDKDITSLAKLSGKDKRHLARLIREASSDKEVGKYIHEGDPRRGRYLIRRGEGGIVGFLTPRKQMSQGKEYYRGGATYVTPSERGKGHASKALTQFFKDRPGLAMVRRGNKPSERGYTRAGFTNKGSVKSQSEKDYDWYVKEAAKRRDYRREYQMFHSSTEAKRNRAKRNLWNRRLKGKVPAGHEIDHKRQLRSGGGNGRDNIRFLPISKNRAEHNRTKVVRDHMRKTSSALKGAIIGGGLGGAIGAADSPDGMRMRNAFAKSSSYQTPFNKHQWVYDSLLY